MGETESNENQVLAELMAAAKAGNTEAFSEIYEKFFTPVYRYTLRKVSNPDHAEDITQTVFMKAFQSLHRFEYQGKSPLSYFFTIARNSVIDFFRKESKYVNVENTVLEETIGSEDSVEDIIHNDDAQAALINALKSLPEEQNAALTLRFIDGLSNAEISETLNKSLANVRQLQSRAIGKLRKYTSLKIHL